MTEGGPSSNSFNGTRVYLVQHGLAEPEDVNPERPLNAQGVAETQVLAEYLPQHETVVEEAAQMGLPLEIWHSGKLRAQQTAELVAKSLVPEGWETHVKKVDGMNPKDPAERFLTDALRKPQRKCVMLCGHLPFLQELATLMVSAADGSNAPSMPPFSNSCLFRFDDDSARARSAFMWAKNCAEMKTVLQQQNETKA
eukprot:g2991.t1